MNTFFNIFRQMVLIMLCAISVSACAYSGDPAEGTILEEGTNKPISGVNVVVRWEGTALSFAHSQSVCIHVESTITDERGHYYIPAWTASAQPMGVRDLRPIVTAHKIGYQRSEVVADKSGVRFLKRFVGESGERLAYLMRVLGNSGCGGENESSKNSLPLLKALRDEAISLAKTDDEKSKVETINYSIETLELGFREAERRHLNRIKK